MSNPILQTTHLEKRFGGLVAVSDVNLSIEQSSTHSIIGPNGAGKTTLFNLLSGNLKPTRGVVMFKGDDITPYPLHRRAHLGIGRSFQITNIFPHLTVLENVRLASQAISPQAINFWRRADVYREHEERAIEVLELVGLGDFILAPATTLPHGGKRKLELAILLAPDPDVLLLDEPTAGMASEQVPELMDTIRRIREETNKTIVMVEHNMRVVMGISDRITVMNMGQILAEGTPQEIASDQTVQSVYLGELYSSVDEMAQKAGH